MSRPSYEWATDPFTAIGSRRAALIPRMLPDNCGRHPEGPIVAYRDRSDTEIRDIYVSRSVGSNWSQPVAVHRDNWQIAACPVNGPALSADGTAVALAWFTAKGDEGHTFNGC